MDSEPIDTIPEKPKRDLPDEIGGVPAEPSYDIPLDVGGVEQKRKPKTEQRSRRRWPFWVLAGCLLPCCLCCVLPLCTFGTGAAVIGSIMDHNRVSTTRTDTVSVLDGAVVTLDVELILGDIHIEPGPSDEIIVRQEKTAYGLSKTAARRALDGIEVAITQPDETTVNIDVDQARTEDSWFSRASTVDLTISVPEGAHLILNTTVGQVLIQDVRVSSLDVTNTVGEIQFEGELPTDATAALRLESTTGAVIVRLPQDVHVAIDADTNVGEITISDGFDRVNRESGSTDGPNVSWLGTLGQGSGNPPTLNLMTNVGEIRVEPR